MATLYGTNLAFPASEGQCDGMTIMDYLTAHAPTCPADFKFLSKGFEEGEDNPEFQEANPVIHNQYLIERQASWAIAYAARVASLLGGN